MFQFHRPLLRLDVGRPGAGNQRDGASSNILGLCLVAGKDQWRSQQYGEPWRPPYLLPVETPHPFPRARPSARHCEKPDRQTAGGQRPDESPVPSAEQAATSKFRCKSKQD
ncbi:hypothetical protein HU200_039109 [Digitaria exilis]|uniref:Uncharacterized protein n=1 Tax=Digitaria exilis TaxID=1010633 RepID=A0A835EJ03_9POAL|nr:hypothetical protein HU200_039109 [Digitaria exilis]